MVDALRWKTVSLASMCGQWALVEEFRDLDVENEFVNDIVMLAAMSVFQPQLIQRIKDSQFQDPELAKV